MTDEIVVVVPAPDTNIPEPPDPTLAQPEPIGESEPVVPPAPPAPAPLPELRYKYQPTDEHGNRLGGEQVILYRTPDELADKLRDQNVQLVRKLREVTRKQRLGITDDDPTTSNLERLVPEKRTLTTEERYQLSQDFSDPTKVEEARDKLLESAGFHEMQLTVRQLQAQTNFIVFRDSHPEFYASAENTSTLIDWMVKNNLQPTVKNFEAGLNAMEQAGLLVQSPIVREEAPVAVPAVQPPPVVENTVPNSQVPVAEVARISEPTQPQTKSQARVPSGLNSRIASDSGAPLPTTSAWTLAKIDALSSDDFRKLTRDPEFCKELDRLEATRPPKPRRA